MTAQSRVAPRPMALARRLPSLLVGLLGLALIVAAALELPVVLLRLQLPFQIDPSEGVIVGEVRLLLQGVNIWGAVTPERFIAAPYPPLLYLLLMPFTAAGAPQFATARFMTLSATVLLAVVLALIVAWRTRQVATGLFAAGIWLSANLVEVWAVRARPDLLALLANLIGLAVVWHVADRLDANRSAAASAISASKGSSTPGSRWQRVWSSVRPEWSGAIVVAALLFAAGFFFKHTALAAPLAAGLFLLLRRPSAAVGLGLAYAVAVAVPYLLLDLISAGGLTQHLVTFHRSWVWRNYVELAQPFFTAYWPLLLLPLGAAGFDLARRRVSLPTLYLATAALVSLGGGTHGGNHNHLLEVLLAVALASGIALGAALPSRLAVPALLLAAITAATLLLEPGSGRAWLAGDLRGPTPADRLGWQQVLPVVTADPGPVYSDNVGLLAGTGHPILVTDPFTMAGSVEAGLWSDRPLVEAIRRQEFSLLALRYDVGRLRGVPTDITPEVLAAIREHYEVVERNVMFLYRPRG